MGYSPLGKNFFDINKFLAIFLKDEKQRGLFPLESFSFPSALLAVPRDIRGSYVNNAVIWFVFENTSHYRAVRYQKKIVISVGTSWKYVDSADGNTWNLMESWGIFGLSDVA